MRTPAELTTRYRDRGLSEVAPVRDGFQVARATVILYGRCTRCPAPPGGVGGGGAGR